MNPQNNTLQFLFGWDTVKIDFSKAESPKPSTSVLNWIREFRGFKGTKEGCGEGDCGACTVVIAEVNKDTLTYTAVDSCLYFLPMLHGKQLITVEHLPFDGKLHPVQQKLLEKSGTQCGYCTPGIVMSLFALYKQKEIHATKELQEGLTGNLCRCTGYKPILDAAEEACGHRLPDIFDQKETETLLKLKEISFQSNTLSFQTAHQEYIKVFSLNECLEAKAQYPHAHLVNGASDVALLQTKKGIFLNQILDISAVNELRFIQKEEGGVRLGAGITMNLLYRWSKENLPAMADLLEVFGSPQIRNVATLGGNIGSASPIGDTLPLLFILNAEVEVKNKFETYTLPIDQFIISYRKTACKPHEIIHSVFIPDFFNHTIKVYKISKRKHLDISTVNAAFKIKLDHGVVTDFDAAYGGMAETTKKPLDLCRFLISKTWNHQTLSEALPYIEKAFSPISDARSEKEYRALLAKNLLVKFFNETCEK